jgi:hypothetical protein
MSNSNYKDQKCYSCPTVLRVDRHTEWCQCYSCISTNQPRPRHHDCDDDLNDADQLELGEVAS